MNSKISGTAAYLASPTDKGEVSYEKARPVTRHSKRREMYLDAIAQGCSLLDSLAEVNP